MANRKPRIRIQQVVRTTRFIGVAGQLGIPTGTLVTVVATGSGRYQVESPAGTRLWCDADAIEAI